MRPASPAKTQKIPTFIYALAFVILFIIQIAWVSQKAHAVAHGNTAFAIGYVQGYVLLPIVLVAAIASIWKPNRGFRGVVRVLFFTLLICVFLKAVQVANAILMPGTEAVTPHPMAVPAVLSLEDKSALLKEAEITQTAINKSDVNTMLSHTPDVIFRLFGKDAFEQQARVAMAKNAGIKFLITEFQDPTNAYQTTNELICFLPRTSTIQVQGRRFRSIAYWVAVRESGDPQWKFVDGAGFQKDSQILWKVFPELPADIRLPEYKQELAD
jgi:hypothetical protein